MLDGFYDMKPRSKSISTTETPGTKRPRATFEEKPAARTTKKTSSTETLKESVRVTTTPAGSPKISPDAIERRAHEIWLREGQPEGRHLEHWFRAEEELRKERQG